MESQKSLRLQRLLSEHSVELAASILEVRKPVSNVLLTKLIIHPGVVERLTINQPYLTIAAQTAPGKGIIL